MKAHNPSAQEWCNAYRRVPGPVAVAVSGLVDLHIDDIVKSFSRELLAQPETAHFIPVGVLNSRLLPSIQRWLRFLFDPANASSSSTTIALQRHVGDMHARAGIPTAMIWQGFRSFKRDLNTLFPQTSLDREQLLQASLYAGELLDLAQAEMVQAQGDGLVRGEFSARSSHHGSDASAVDSYSGPSDRQRATTQLEAERHEQLMALSDEESRFLRSMLSNVAIGEVKALGSSPFGLWLNHKAPLLFEEAAELGALTRIAQTIDRLDTTVLPRLQEGLSHATSQTDGLDVLMREVVAGLEDIRDIVNTLFDRLASTDGYRDALTQLFNRPLLASIMRREMELARRKRSTFSVLLVDIDHFREVNQTHGHDVGNRVLQHVATLLAAQVRSSDFVFRYGGEEFLIMLVELDAEQSMAVAEKIRRVVENADIPLAGGLSVQVTLSLGVALYDGQPDPQSITDLADQALDRAKGSGRNQVCLAHD